MSDLNTESLFLKSALTETNPMNSTESVLEWITFRNNAVEVSIEKIDFSEMTNWKFYENSFMLAHTSGSFFSIDGIRVQTNWGKINEWEQPIINQPEIGYLGFITKVMNGILYFLVQAKIEPGNVNNVQLSPTLQATKSNYTQVHKGKKPNYLKYFQECNPKNVLLDQLQSEQGARFLQKRNRNIIIVVNENIEVKDDFLWLTLGQIKNLAQYDNIVNMDTRTVISGIPFGSYNKQIIDLFSTLINNESSLSVKNILLNSILDHSSFLYSHRELIGWLTSLKCKYDLNIKKIPLNRIKDWEISRNEISHKDKKFFKVIAARIIISNREVTIWDQPLIEPAHHGIIAFIIKEIDGVFYFLVQAKLECGNFDILELAPTVQCLTGSYQNHESSVPFLNYILEAKKEQILFDTLQSEEGGRFFHEQNRNLIIIATNDFNPNLPENFIWMTFNQLAEFIKYNNYLNIQARSLLSTISFM